MIKNEKGRIIIPGGIRPWAHELRVANILAMAGHTVEFLPTRSTKTADILLDGIEYEIKSPRTSKVNSLDHLLRRAAYQSPNIIIDSSRINGGTFSDRKMQAYLSGRLRRYKRIKRLIFITRSKKVIDIRPTA